MKLELFSRIALARDVPKHHLQKGDLARIIDYLDDPEPGYALEVFDVLGNTVDVLSVPESYVEALQVGERPHVRHVEADAL